jgi:CheY-like chemotaxis protein
MSNRKLVIVVDDESDYTYALISLLHRELPDCEFMDAHDGHEALIKLAGNEADVLITDLRMPNVDGMELLRTIRLSSPSTRIIVMTAYGRPGLPEDLRKLGVYHYMNKPFQDLDVTQVVRSALNSDPPPPLP